MPALSINRPKRARHDQNSVAASFLARLQNVALDRCEPQVRMAGRVEKLQMTIRASVPCNGCRACCVRDLIVLHPECGDRIEDYECQSIINPLTGQQTYALKRNERNECIYLGIDGCSIHERAPVICKEFDCRRAFQKWSRKDRRMLVANGVMSKEVFDAGRQRIKSL